MLVVDQIVWVKRRHIFEFSQNTILHKRFNAKNQARGRTLRPQKKTRSIQILDIFKMNSLQMSPDVSSLPSLHSPTAPSDQLASPHCEVAVVSAPLRVAGSRYRCAPAQVAQVAQVAGVREI
jgi:hypothetical protein